MPGNIMPVGFKIEPRAVTSMICSSTVAATLDVAPRCGRCGSTYCPTCVANGEASLRCPREADDCPMDLHSPEPPTAA
jgi:hypothetical protein